MNTCTNDEATRFKQAILDQMALIPEPTDGPERKAYATIVGLCNDEETVCLSCMESCEVIEFRDNEPGKPCGQQWFNVKVSKCHEFEYVRIQP